MYSSLVQVFGNGTNAKLSVGRAALGAALVGQVAVFGGGQTDGGVYTDAVDIIPLTGTGSQATAKLIEPRAYTTGASTKTSAYFVAGFRADGSRSNVIDKYHQPSGKWSQLKLPIGRSNHTSVGIDNYVFVAGGTLDQDPVQVTDLVNIIKEDPSTGEAQFLDDVEIFGNRTNLASLSFTYKNQSQAWFVGGEGPSCGCEIGWMCTPDFSFCASGLVNVIYPYDNGTFGITWSLLGSIECRSSLAAAAYGNLVFFAGGKNITGWSDMVDIYDMDADEWSTETLSVPRGHLVASTTTDGKVYFAGGVNDNGVSQVVDVYDAKARTWI